MSKTVLVTGATGTVGRAVVRGLLAAQVPVRAAYHHDRVVELFKEVEPEYVQLDMDNLSSVEAAFQNIDKVFLLTPPSPNMEALGLRLVEAAKKAKIRHVVRLSVMGADAAPGIRLTQWHRSIEKSIESSGLPYTFLRPNAFMQNFLAMVSGSIKTDGVFPWAGGEGKVSYIDIRDIAATAVAILTHAGYEGKAFTLTGPQALSGSEIANEFGRALGRSIRFTDVSLEEARAGMLAQKYPEVMVDALIELFQLYRKGGAAQVTQSVKNVTARDPITAEQFLQDHLNAFQPA